MGTLYVCQKCNSHKVSYYASLTKSKNKNSELGFRKTNSNIRELPLTLGISVNF